MKTKEEVQQAYECKAHGNSCFTCKDCEIEELKDKLYKTQCQLADVVINDQSSLNLLNRAEVAEAELARYKGGVEVLGLVGGGGSRIVIAAGQALPHSYLRQRVRVLVMPVEDL